MATQTLGIILNGATGRIGSTQHLANALAPMRAEGGLTVGDERVMPRVLLIGRNVETLKALASTHGVEFSTDLDQALSDPAFPVLFDAAATHQRQAVLAKAIAAGKHIYAEKPVAPSVTEGLALLQAAQAHGLKHGAVEDKLGLPGLTKLKCLADQSFFGRVVGFRIEFGWWVFDGLEAPCQRPSWNYKRESGGGLVLDMYPHWRYIIEGILGPMRRAVTALSTATPERIDEQAKRYDVDVEDTAQTIVELESGAYGTLLSSWATRVRRDDLLTFQIDGTEGSALAGLHRCWTQTAKQALNTAHFNVTKDIRADYSANWSEVPHAGPYKNPYRIGWEHFLRHVVADAPMAADFAAGVRDVQFAEACYRSAQEGKWVSLDALS
jgi:predicted dehydrogenase